MPKKVKKQVSKPAKSAVKRSDTAEIAYQLKCLVALYELELSNKGLGQVKASQLVKP